MVKQEGEKRLFHSTAYSATGRKWPADHFAYRASRERVRKLLLRLGFRHLKSKPFPSNAKKVEEWLEGQQEWVAHLEKLHGKAHKGKIGEFARNKLRAFFELLWYWMSGSRCWHFLQP